MRLPRKNIVIYYFVATLLATPAVAQNNPATVTTLKIRLPISNEILTKTINDYPHSVLL